MPVEVALLPCPVCGHVPEKFDWQSAPDGWSAQVYCSNCDMVGPSHREKFREAWNALPRKLKWTKEKPTQEGWYWHYQGLSFGTVIEYVDMEIGPTGGVLEDERWAGPIPEPEE